MKQEKYFCDKCNIQFDKKDLKIIDLRNVIYANKINLTTKDLCQKCQKNLLEKLNKAINEFWGI